VSSRILCASLRPKSSVRVESVKFRTFENRQFGGRLGFGLASFVLAVILWLDLIP